MSKGSVRCLVCGLAWVRFSADREPRRTAELGARKAQLRRRRECIPSGFVRAEIRRRARERFEPSVLLTSVTPDFSSPPDIALIVIAAISTKCVDIDPPLRLHPRGLSCLSARIRIAPVTFAQMRRSGVDDMARTVDTRSRVRSILTTMAPERDPMLLNRIAAPDL